jgi:7-cyano-7-deazaguanine reductase
MQFLNWDFSKTMEGMDDATIKERIEKAYNWPMPALRPIPYVGEKGIVTTYETNEMIARCPATGYPDTYRLIIDFIPNEVVPELKTLRFYFMDFYTLPISHEHLCAKIYKEFGEQVKPTKLYVRLLTAVRGGIYTTVQLGDASIASDTALRQSNMSL